MNRKLKKLFNKCIMCVMRVIPVIMPVILIINANSTASSINGQPKPPKGLKNYRKF